MSKAMGDAVIETLKSFDEKSEQLNPANVVDGLFAIARALEYVGRAIDRLGNADAGTPMGGLEALGKCILDSVDGLGMVMGSVFSDLSGSIDSLADAVSVSKLSQDAEVSNE